MTLKFKGVDMNKILLVLVAVCTCAFGQVDSTISRDRKQGNVVIRPCEEIAPIIKDHQIKRNDTIEIIGRLLERNDGGKTRLFKYVYIDTVKSSTSYKTMLRNVGFTISEVPTGNDTTSGK